MPSTALNTPSSSIDCAWLLAAPGSQPAQANARIHLAGAFINAVEPLAAAPAGPRKLVMPALVNAHDHARTFRSATLGAFGMPLETWLPFFGTVLPSADPYLCAATSFARSARNGVTNLMVHYTRVQGGMNYLDEALSVARAARDVGVHIGFAVAMRDRHGIGLCDDTTVLAALRPSLRQAVSARLSVRPLQPAEHLAVVDALAQALKSEPDLAEHVTVQYGPTGVQWCSSPLLEAVALAAHDTGRPVHMHLLETRYQRDWADQAFPKGIVNHLDAIGLLGPQLTLAHCTWARPEELALLAERGVTIAVNTSSNLGLKSGIAPVPTMLSLGCRVAMGLDGMAFNEDDDALHEIRLTYALQRGWGFDTKMTPEQLWFFAAQTGRRTVRGAVADLTQGGLIASDAPADIVVLDWDRLDDDSLFENVNPLDLLLARGLGVHIEQVIAAGRTIVANGRVTGIDEAAFKGELVACMRSALAASPGADIWRSQLGELAEDLGPFYRRGSWVSCC